MKPLSRCGSYSSRSSMGHFSRSRSAYVAKRWQARPGRDRPGCEVHDLRVRHVRVREDAEVDILAADQALELVLGDDGDTVRVERSGEGCGIAPSVDARDLRRGEGDDPAVGLVPENRVEVVEIAARRAQDDDMPYGALHGRPSGGAPLPCREAPRAKCRRGRNEGT